MAFKILPTHVADRAEVQKLPHRQNRKLSEAPTCEQSSQLAINLSTLSTSAPARGRVSSSHAAFNLEFRLGRRNQIKLARRLFIKQRAFFLVSTTPVFVSSGHSQEVTWADALLARFVFI